MTPAKKQKLKPCECGAKKLPFEYCYFDGMWMIICDSCGKSGRLERKKKEAIAAWNHRPKGGQG